LGGALFMTLWRANDDCGSFERNQGGGEPGFHDTGRGGDPEIKKGANVVKGKVTHQGVADVLGLEYVPIDRLL